MRERGRDNKRESEREREIEKGNKSKWAETTSERKSHRVRGEERYIESERVRDNE